MAVLTAKRFMTIKKYQLIDDNISGTNNVRNKISKAKRSLHQLGMQYLYMLALLLFSNYLHATCSWMDDNYTTGTVPYNLGNRTVQPTNTSAGKIAYTFTYGSALSSSVGAPKVTTPIVYCTAASDTISVGSDVLSVGTLSGGFSLFTPYWFKIFGDDIDIGLQFEPSSQNWFFPTEAGSGIATFTMSQLNAMHNIYDSTTQRYLITSQMLFGNSNSVAIGAHLYKGNSSLVTGGSWPGGIVATITASGMSSVIGNIVLNAFTVTVPTCTVNNYDSTVELGTAYAQQMHSPGSTSNSQNFAINMSCASTILSPTITFVGETDSNYPTVFNNNAGSATGVGVQLLYKGNPITPSTAVSLGQVTSTSAIDYNFQARMYQILSSVTAGTLDFTTTFTISYE